MRFASHPNDRRAGARFPDAPRAYNPAMFRLTREVRLGINLTPDEQLDHKPANSYAGHPSLSGFGSYLTLAVTLRGELRPESSYLRNIKDVDDAVRRLAAPLLARGVREGRSPVRV